jgi:Co/Zn/Cd efflux system component
MSTTSEFSNDGNHNLEEINQKTLIKEEVNGENSYDLPRQRLDSNKKINDQMPNENHIDEEEILKEEVESRPKQIKNEFNRNEESENSKNKKRRNKNKNKEEKYVDENLEDKKADIIYDNKFDPNLQNSSSQSDINNENKSNENQMSVNHVEEITEDNIENNIEKSSVKDIEDEIEGSNLINSAKHEYSIRDMKREKKNSINNKFMIENNNKTSDTNSSCNSDPYSYLQSEASEVKNLLNLSTEKNDPKSNSHPHEHNNHSHSDTDCHHHDHHHHNSSSASAIEISLNTKKCSHNHDHDHHHHDHHESSHSDSNKKYQHDQEKFKISFDFIINSSLKLIKTNEEFFYLVILLGIWLSLILFEFIYGFLETQVHIISDSFFNYFKTFSFLIAGLAILLTRISAFKESFLKNRIELIAALSNCVFLIIVSMYMVLQALHMVTEPDENHDDSSAHSHQPINQEEQDTISFFKNFFIVKVIIDVIGVLVFSDYIVHPSVQIKLLLWKKHRVWKELKDLSIENLKECKLVIKQWNNHYENMNALTVNILSDLLSSILFLICFYVSKDRHFEGVYCFISIVNLVFLFFLLAPLLKSLIKIFMQGRSELYECFYDKLYQEVSYFEGCLGIKDMKFWMTAQNDIKCKIKING